MSWPHPCAHVTWQSFAPSDSSCAFILPLELTSLLAVSPMHCSRIFSINSCNYDSAWRQLVVTVRLPILPLTLGKSSIGPLSGGPGLANALDLHCSVVMMVEQELQYASHELLTFLRCRPCSC